MELDKINISIAIMLVMFGVGMAYYGDYVSASIDFILAAINVYFGWRVK